MQADGCFWQHGPLMQTGSYGEGYLSDVLGYAGLAEGTSYAMSDASRAVLDLAVLDGFQVCLCVSAAPIHFAEPSPSLTCLQQQGRAQTPSAAALSACSCVRHE